MVEWDSDEQGHRGYVSMVGPSRGRPLDLSISRDQILLLLRSIQDVILDGEHDGHHLID